jgi:hypothetical protein
LGFEVESMQLGHRSLLLGVCSLLLVSGCDFSSPWGSSSTGSEYGSGTATVTTGSGGGSGTGGGTGPTGVGGEAGVTGSNDTVVATPSIAGIVSVVTGSTQTVSVTFTSSDGLAITGFGISASLSTLPSGWSGPTVFTCTLVSAGSGCVLNLTYAPTAIDSGTLTLNYIYVNNQNIPKTPGGSVTISYAATPNNNVIATVSPTGQVEAAVGAGSQSISVNFTTDDDNAATDLTLNTSLAALPSGWSSTATSLSCAIVSSGNGCQLMLTFAPTAAARGTLVLNYSYMDDSGAPQIGSVNIAYATSSANNVIATASPAGEVIAIEKTGGQPVAVTFTTDDGQAATNLSVISNLRALPSGWSSSSGSLTCGSVSTGNGCQLHLTYAPTALTSGTLALSYAYTDSSGAPQIGLLDVPYAATTNNNVVATPSQSGQVNAVVGMGSQAVSVTFTTDDGRLATALQLTSSLATLPSGWTSTATSLACAAVSSGTSCQLNLMYTPTAWGTGTLALSYAYKNNDGEPKTGTLNIPYRATTNDTVAGTPTQPSVAVITGNSTTVDVVFATDDGNPASALSVTPNLPPLPAGWSSTSNSLTCSTVSAGTPCQLTLTYAPTAAASGSLNLGFSYTNDAGLAKTGTVTINYRATTNDTVAGLPSQSPLAVLTGSSTPITVTFTTNDGNPASGLAVTSGLPPLLAGWSSSSGSFTCSSVSVGTGCQLTLTYAPTVAGSGTLTLGFSYLNNSGMPYTGTVAIPYSATP